MGNLLQTPAAQAVLWVAVGLILALIGFYLIRKARDRNNEEDTTVDHLANFREMRVQGLLNDGEFRTIKTSLGKQLVDETKQLARDE